MEHRKNPEGTGGVRHRGNPIPRGKAETAGLSTAGKAVLSRHRKPLAEHRHARDLRGRLRLTLDGRSGGPLTHSSYTTLWDTIGDTAHSVMTGLGPVTHVFPS
jgi:hypothetical protein